jgi:hypothetical protein
MINKPKTWLTRRQQAQRYSIHPRTLDRWGSDPAMGLPPEAFNGRPHRAEDELEAWGYAQRSANSASIDRRPPSEPGSKIGWL